MDIGSKIIEDLSNGQEYCDVLSRHCEEIEEAEEMLKKGSLPSVFRLHSKESPIAPETPEEYLMLLGLLEIRQSKYPVFKELVEKVLGYPLSYYAVKEKVFEALKDVCRENILRCKKLDPSLFRAMLAGVSRCTKAFTHGAIVPWVREGMTSTAALVMGRVVMKSTSEKEYMEEFIQALLEEKKDIAVFTLLTCALIKRIKLSPEVLERVVGYIQKEDRVEGRCLTWNKLVLVFVRGYKDVVDLEGIPSMYNHANPTPIEKEIQKELGVSQTAE
ncbi:hypothetical protein NECID01_0502 [Nematocida sp. AWRm77]|nr:hypothetical protein NECID01_0502 [Nematocida sp. AWRm77]